MIPKRHNKNGDVFKWNSAKWRDYFEKRGISEAIPRFSGTIVEKAKKGARFFASVGYNSFSGIELTAIMYPDQFGIDERTSRSLHASVGGEIRRHYLRFSRIKAELQMPYIHFLRIETGNNRSNLHELRGYEIQDGVLVKVRGDVIYPDLIISGYDWAEGICLPKPEDFVGERGFELGQLFGYYWCAGTLFHGRGNTYTTTISFTEDTRESCEQEAGSLMQSIHNITMWDKDNWDPESGPVQIAGIDLELKGCALYKTSQVLAFYLMGHRMPFENQPGKSGKTLNLNVYQRKPKHLLPEIPWTEDTLDGFVLTHIKRRGNDCLTPTKEGAIPLDRIDISGEGDYGVQLSGLLTAMRYSHSLIPREKKGGWVLHLYQEPSSKFRGMFGSTQRF